MSNYLLEIGVEEFPSRFVKTCKEQLQKAIEEAFQENGLVFENLRLESTPRRFSLWLDAIHEEKKEEEEIVKGPSKKIAFDEQGNPSKALLGFMRSKGITQDDIYIDRLGKEDYVFAKLEMKRKSIKELLTLIIPQSIRQISIPRSMRWSGKNLLFARPIRWLVSLYDDEVLPCDLEGIPVSNVTKGHRFLGQDHIEISSIAEYEDKLKENYVIIDEKIRRDMILRGLNLHARLKGGKPLMDEDLLDEVIHIVEYPTVFIGNIPEEYLSLPEEVIITPMKDHQRYFPVVKEDQLLPYFLSVRNGDERGLENVIAGNEKVLVPRLEDAKFFFEQDKETSMEDFTERLKGLAFHEKLGSMLDKSKRLEELVTTIGKQLSCGEEMISHAQRAAVLSKFDLASKMVIEFTELQGVMGRIYSLEKGENPIVAQAIEEQYLPRKSAGKLAQSTVGSILSLADKIDSIAGLFAIDTNVTGSQDPFGLRRAAIGIIDILLKNKMHLDLKQSFRDSLFNYVEQQGIAFDYEEVNKKVEDFFLGRLETKMKEDGIPYDVVNAVLHQTDGDILSFYRRGQAVMDFLKEEENYEHITSFVRIASLAKHDDHFSINEEVLEEADREIYESLACLKDFQDLLRQRQYEESLEKLADWMPMINQYLDQTMIMVDDEELRQSRLAMLSFIYEPICAIFDPSEIYRE